jgi:multiple sugar transport system substrate-binding protein
VRNGTRGRSNRLFGGTWSKLDVGIDRRAPLGELYEASMIDEIVGARCGPTVGVAMANMALASR